MSLHVRSLFCGLLTLLPMAASAEAQTLGTYRWQLLPYCNVLTLSVTLQGTMFSLIGFDDQCGAGQRASVTGAAFPNPDGTIGIGLSLVGAPGGGNLQLEARISLATLGGVWQDGGGRDGSFVFAPNGSSGGSPRPIARRVSRVFQPEQITWAPTTRAGSKFREAVLDVPEISPTVLNSGSVTVAFASPTLPEPWTPLPIVNALSSGVVVSLFYSVDVGRVVLRVHQSTSGDVSPPALPFKVTVVP